MSEEENTVPGIKYPQWCNGKTLSRNAMSRLKFSAFIITHIFFTFFVKHLYRHKRLCEV